jgi:hypothetical protein
LIAYYYIKKEETEETCECGLKLSVWCDSEVIIDIFKKKAIIAYLSPKDHLEKYNDPTYDCLKLELQDEKLYVADYIYKEIDDEKRYLLSVINVKDYKIGMYRKPVFTITYTVLGEYVSLLDKNMDIPILYDNSEEMYVKTMYAKFEEDDEQFYDKALLGYLEKHKDSKKINNSNETFATYSLHEKVYVIRKDK